MISTKVKNSIVVEMRNWCGSHRGMIAGWICGLIAVFLGGFLR